MLNIYYRDELYVRLNIDQMNIDVAIAWIENEVYRPLVVDIERSTDNSLYLKEEVSHAA